MKYLDLNAQYKSIKKEVDLAIQRVLNSTQFILGKEVEYFEKKLAQYCRTKYAVGVNSGTDALLLSLIALDIKRGDEIIVPSFTFIATADVIPFVGVKPIFVDINPQTFNIDTNKIEKKITKKTKAIIPVHLFGQPAEMDKIMQISKKYKLRVIEDCAQSIGATYKNKTVGSIGDMGCLSFYPSKNLGAHGDGGMVITNSKKLADKIKLIRTHGTYKKYHHKILGINSRLDALQAVILEVKLNSLNKWTRSRQKKAALYNKELGKIKQVTIPFVKNHNTHVYHQYTIRAKNRNKLQQSLKKNNIPSIVYYPLPLHLQPVFKYLGYKKGDLPASEKVSREVLSLPIYPELPQNQQNYIIKKIKEFYDKQKKIYYGLNPKFSF